MICKTCNVEMVKGIAIEGNVPHGCLAICWPGYLTNKTMKIIDCLKCPKCGHSDDNE